jgi:hypothetical protein
MTPGTPLGTAIRVFGAVITTLVLLLVISAAVSRVASVADFNAWSPQAAGGTRAIGQAGTASTMAA